LGLKSNQINKNEDQIEKVDTCHHIRLTRGTLQT